MYVLGFVWALLLIQDVSFRDRTLHYSVVTVCLLPATINTDRYVNIFLFIISLVWKNSVLSCPDICDSKMMVSFCPYNIICPYNIWTKRNHHFGITYILHIM